MLNINQQKQRKRKIIDESKRKILDENDKHFQVYYSCFNNPLINKNLDNFVPEDI